MDAIEENSEIKKGQEMRMITAALSKQVKRIKAPFEAYVFCVNHLAVISQGEALFHVGTVQNNTLFDMESMIATKK